MFDFSGKTPWSQAVVFTAERAGAMRRRRTVPSSRRGTTGRLRPSRRGRAPTSRTSESSARWTPRTQSQELSQTMSAPRLAGGVVVSWPGRRGTRYTRDAKDSFRPTTSGASPSVPGPANRTAYSPTTAKTNSAKSAQTTSASTCAAFTAKGRGFTLDISGQAAAAQIGQWSRRTGRRRTMLESRRPGASRIPEGVAGGLKAGEAGADVANVRKRVAIGSSSKGAAPGGRRPEFLQAAASASAIGRIVFAGGFGRADRASHGG